MVQTEDQYIFIHEALLEAATCGNTEVLARNLFAHIQKLSQVPPGESVTAMELEFKVSRRAFIVFSADVRTLHHRVTWLELAPLSDISHKYLNY